MQFLPRIHSSELLSLFLWPERLVSAGVSHEDSSAPWSLTCHSFVLLLFQHELTPFPSYITILSSQTSETGYGPYKNDNWRNKKSNNNNNHHSFHISLPLGFLLRTSLSMIHGVHWELSLLTLPIFSPTIDSSVLSNLTSILVTPPKSILSRSPLTSRWLKP